MIAMQLGARRSASAFACCMLHAEREREMSALPHAGGVGGLISASL
jgi:hypothetical protein